MRHQWACKAEGHSIWIMIDARKAMSCIQMKCEMGRNLARVTFTIDADLKAGSRRARLSALRNRNGTCLTQLAAPLALNPHSVTLTHIASRLLSVHRSFQLNDSDSRTAYLDMTSRRR